LKALAPRNKRVPDLQEWKRSDAEHKFQLTKLQTSILRGEEVCELLPLETHLEDLTISSNKSLFGVLPRCQSIRSLDLGWIETNEQIASLCEALLLAPFIHSLILETDNLDLSSLPLSSLKSFTLTSNSLFESVSQALTKSKPKSLTTLELHQLEGTFDPLARVLLEIPSLTSLTISEAFSQKLAQRDILPVVQVLHRLPLVSLGLELMNFTDESIECLLSFLSRSAVQDLRLGTLSPKQLQMVADAVPELSCLHSLEYRTFDFDRCEHESSHLALFSALTRSSSIRSLKLYYSSFRRAALEVCLNKIPETQLTGLYLCGAKIYTDGFDSSYKQLDRQSWEHLIDWKTRYPQNKDRFCHISLVNY
jgi:hypothetical protein